MKSDMHVAERVVNASTSEYKAIDRSTCGMIKPEVQRQYELET
jgi:hypothetical protein